jgi:hypothetical protein
MDYLVGRESGANELVSDNELKLIDRESSN